VFIENQTGLIQLWFAKESFTYEPPLDIWFDSLYNNSCMKDVLGEENVIINGSAESTNANMNLIWI
jgi:hypothetical protein